MKKIFLNLILALSGLTLIIFNGCDAEESDLTSDSVSAISVTSPPVKEKYYLSDTELDTTGLVVTASYRSGRTEVIPNDELTFEGFNDDSGKTVSSRTIKVLYGEGVNLRYTTFSITYKDLSSISILNSPTKIKYNQGDSFEIDGLMIQAAYLDNTAALLSLSNFRQIGEKFNISDDGSATMTITGFDSSAGGSSQTITVAYSETDGTNVNDRYATFSITYTDLASLSVTRQPDKIKYHHGEEFDLTGLVVTATYMDNTTAAVSLANFSKIGEEFNVTSDGKSKMTISGFDSTQTISSQTITLTYSEETNSTTIVRYAQFAVTYVDLASISITTSPSRKYFYGESFATDGLVVTATYLDNSSRVLSLGNYSKIGEEFAEGTGNGKIKIEGFDSSVSVSSQTVTVRYAESGTFADDTDKTAQLSVVFADLSSISITQQPAKIKYHHNETFDITDLSIIATYLDNSSVKLSLENYKKIDTWFSTGSDRSAKMCISGFDSSQTISSQTITVSYSETVNSHEIIRTAQFAVTYSDLASISITSSPVKKYHNRESLSVDGLVVTATYLDNSTRILSLANYVKAGEAFDEGTAGKLRIDGFDSSKSVSSETITVRYAESGTFSDDTDKTAQFSVTFCDLASLSITKQPYKLEYTHSSTKLDLSGLMITATYLDNTTREIDATSGDYTKPDPDDSSKSICMSISGFKPEENVTSQTITMVYYEATNYNTTIENRIFRSVQFTITYTDLASITITKQPENLTYVMKNILGNTSSGITDVSGFTLDTTGLEVTATYQNNKTAVLDNSKLSFSGFNPINVFKDNITSQTILVSYTDGSVTKTTSFSVTYQWGASYNWHEQPVKKAREFGTKALVYFGDFPKTAKTASVVINEYLNMTRGGLVFYLGSDGNYYSRLQKGTTTDYYYYKVEPITWFISNWKKDDNSHTVSGIGYVYILTSTDCLISGIPYYTGKIDRTVTETKTVYSTSSDNWQTVTNKEYVVKPYSFRYSMARNYLNGDHENGDSTYDSKGFVQSAFTEKAQNILQPNVINENILCNKTVTVYKKDSTVNTGSCSYTANAEETATFTCKAWLNYAYNGSGSVYGSDTTYVTVYEYDGENRYYTPNLTDYCNATSGTGTTLIYTYCATDYKSHKDDSKPDTYNVGYGYTEANSVNTGYLPSIMVPNDSVKDE